MSERSERVGYVFAFDGKGQFDPAGRVDPPIGDVEAHNRAIEARELAAWQGRPERFVVFVNGGAAATTWLGTPLGRVVERRQYKRYSRAGMPYMMESIRVVGTNGAVYVGRHGSDWSEACRVRRARR